MTAMKFVTNNGKSVSGTSLPLAAKLFSHFPHRASMKPLGFPLGCVSAQGRQMPNPLFKPDWLRQPA